MPTNNGGDTAVSDEHPIITSDKQKKKKPKSRQVSSRFLSPSNSSSEHGNNIPSPNNNSTTNTTLSPISTYNHKPKLSKKQESTTGFLLGLWPSSSSSSKPETTLANQLKNDRLKDEKPDQSPLAFLNRQRSCNDHVNIDENGKKKSSAAKENNKYGGFGSMRYNFSNDCNGIIPGRFSIDETALRKKKSSLHSNNHDYSEESEHSDMLSASSLDASTPLSAQSSPTASYMAPTVSSRKQVASKYMQDRSRRWSADSGIPNHNNYNRKLVPFSPDHSYGNNSPNKKFNVNSDGNNRKGKVTSPKPPTSPDSKGKGGVGNLLSKGIEFFKGSNIKSYKYNNSSSNSLVVVGGDDVHQLRLLHNGLMRWRYCNARADAVNVNIIKRAQSNVLGAWNGLIKLQQSVVQKKLQLQKEKLEMKLNSMLQYQIKTLEAWGSIERQHVSAISVTKDYLHSVVCKVPLVDGAKVEPQSASLVLRHASDLAASLNLMISSFSPTVEKSVGVLMELAVVASQEKLLLEECLEIFRTISVLEVHERSLKSNIMQLKTLQLQRHHSNYAYFPHNPNIIQKLCSDTLI